MPEQQPMSVEQFGATIKTQYPQYATVSDQELGERMLAKYPQYRDRVQVPTAVPLDSRGMPRVSSNVSEGPPSELNDMLRHGAQPQSVSDLVGLLLPTHGVGTAIEALQEYVDIAKKAYAASPNLRSLPVSALKEVYQRWTGAVPSAKAAGIAANRAAAIESQVTRGADMYAMPRVDRGPVIEPPTVSSAPPAAGPVSPVASPLDVPTPPVATTAGTAAPPAIAATPLAAPPAAPVNLGQAVVKLKLTAKELVEVQRLTKSGKPLQEALDLVQAQREFQAKYGLTTPNAEETRFPKGQRGGTQPLKPLP